MVARWDDSRKGTCGGTVVTPTSEVNARLGVMGLPSCGDGDYDPENWAFVNFGKAEFGHKRKTDRLVAIAATAAVHGSWSTPVQFRTDAEAKAACRLFNSAVVTHAAVTASHRQRVIGQARASANPVLFIHDDTMLDFRTDTRSKVSVRLATAR